MRTGVRVRHSYSGGYSRTIIHLVLGIAAFATAAMILRQTLPMVRCAAFRDPVGLGFLFFVVLFALFEALYFYQGWRLVQWAEQSDFSGTYDECSVDGQCANNPVRLKINQDCSTMGITLNYGEATAKSITAAIVKNRRESGDVEISCTYFCTGANNGVERLGAHFGTFILKRRDGGKRLEGVYFTESKYANFSRLNFKLMSRQTI